MDLKLFVPQHSLLKKYIDYFYILQKPVVSESISYYTFPHINSVISINQYPEFSIEKDRLTVKRNEKNPILATLICNYTKPIEIIIPGFIHEITISFKPLGLNAFLAGNLCDYTGKSFAYFDPFEDFTATMHTILAIKEKKEKIEKLETYLLSKYGGFEHPFLHSVIDDMTNADQQYTIEGLARKYNISRKTLCKQFEWHVGKTPTELRKIIRFRQAMQQQLHISPKSKLSDITYQLDFFDQSHLIKDFKSITGYTPKVFFKKVSPIEGGNINWMYL
jgi:AraC-like DNA-binding protein